jgi:hypothetical protein
VWAFRIPRPNPDHRLRLKPVSTNQILLGVGLILVLAVGAQVAAVRLHLPALIPLLPLGFLVGVATDVADPNRLPGPAFQQLVSLSVAVILYDAGLGLDWRELVGHHSRVVRLLVLFGYRSPWRSTRSEESSARWYSAASLRPPESDRAAGAALPGQHRDRRDRRGGGQRAAVVGVAGARRR